MTVSLDRLTRTRPGAHLPPGPSWPAPLQSFALLRFRHRYVPALHRRYGDVFTVRIAPGSSPLVLFTRPEHAREIFSGDPEVFQAGTANAILEPVMGKHSLLLLDSEEHRRSRRLLMPVFNRTALAGYRPLVARLAAEEAARWRPGTPFRSLDRMKALTLEVIMRVVFGVTDEHRLAALRPLVNRTVDVSPLVLVGWEYSALRRLPPWSSLGATQRSLDALLYAEIANRRAAHDLGQRGDVLSRLLAARHPDAGPELSDAELRDQLVTLLLAGHETTASALSWALYELARDADQIARARAAVDQGDDDYLEAVMKEAMRLHPVIPMVLRRLTAPANVGGWQLPAGTTVGASILIAHGRPENHPDPEAFRPDRFLDDRLPPNTWIPFGGGVRRCLGAGFALMEGVAVLHQVLARYDVRLRPHTRDQPKVRNITSVPRRGARIVVYPR